MITIDRDTEFGARVARRLAEDQVIWLTTVGPDGTPQPSPVWFLWDGESVLVYSEPGAPKVRNIARHPRVSLNFDGDRDGGDIVVLTGRATLDPSAPSVDDNAAYLAKYADGIARIGLTPGTMGATYSAAIRITPEKLRGH